jgi:lysophospholipase L1-like esterase
MTYAEHLQHMIPESHIDHLGHGAKSIRYQLRDSDAFLRFFPDYYILNFGIVDASSRSVPEFIFRFINHIPAKRYFIIEWKRKLFGLLELKFRRSLVSLRGQSSWTSEFEFRKKYADIIERIQKETSSKIICLSINPTNKRVEEQLPGTTKKIEAYNLIIQELCTNNNCHYIDAKAIITEEMLPDGIHYNAEGHRRIAIKIADLIQKAN